MSGPFWWYVTRATGIVAWALAGTSVLWGLFVSLRVLRKRPGRGWVLDLHRALGGLTVAFTAGHIAAIVADSYVHFGWADVLLPFASHWHPVAVAWGVIALYLLVAIELTSLLQRRLPRRLWRWVHMSSYAVFVAATVHMLSAGADRRSPALQWAALTMTAAVGALTLARVLVPRTRHAPRPTRTRAPIADPAAEPVTAGARGLG